MRELKLLTGKTVVVATPATAVRGVVGAATRNMLEVVEAVAVDGRSPVPIAGSVLIPVAQVSYVQVLP